ncbi:MAG: IS607 family transposase [Nitrospirae bacterium]|nr:IS607 family transposase [Nitrospirota bacterium]
MRVSDYARRVGVSSRTAWRWFNSGQVRGDQAETGTIILTEPLPEGLALTPIPQVAIYACVSAMEPKDNLDTQAQRLRDSCAAKGSPVALVVKELGSGVHDPRPKLLRLMTDPAFAPIVGEPNDRLTRFGFNSIENLLAMQGWRIEVITLAEDGKEDLLQDCVSIVTPFCARLDGQRRSRRKTARIIAEVRNGEEGHHPLDARPSESQDTPKAG